MNRFRGLWERKPPGSQCIKAHQGAFTANYIEVDSLTSQPPQALGFKSGVVTTSNSLDHTDTDDEHMLVNGRRLHCTDFMRGIL